MPSKFSPNTKSYTCCDTSEDTLLWCNRTDALGLVCAPFVLCIFIFATLAVYLFYQQNYLSSRETLILGVLLIMSVWCHIKVMFSDPGAVPKMAKPIPRDQHLPHVMCGRCDSYKPPLSHHGNWLGLVSLIIFSTKVNFSQTEYRTDVYAEWIITAHGLIMQ